MRGALVRSVSGDAISLPFPADVFDAVFVSAVLGEIPDRQVVLREVHRVLRGTGHLVVVEIRGDPDRIAPGELRSLAGAAGFAPERHRGLGWSYLASFRRVS